MRLLSARLIVSLIIGVTLVSLCSSYYHVLVQKQGLRRDLQRRTEVLGESLAKNVERDMERDGQHNLQRTVQQFANREHLAGLAVYDLQGQPIAITANLQSLMTSAPAIVLLAVKENHSTNAFLRLGISTVNIGAVPLHRDGELIGGLPLSTTPGTSGPQVFAFGKKPSSVH